MSAERFKLPTAVYLIMIQDNQVLLQRRYNTGWMDGHYTLISGHIDGNESVFEAMIREAKEEGAITLTKDQLIPATVLHRKSPDEEYLDFFFVASTWEGTPSIGEPHKCDDLSWFDLDNLPDNLLSYIKVAIYNSKEEIAFSEEGWTSH